MSGIEEADGEVARDENGGHSVGRHGHSNEIDYGVLDDGRERRRHHGVSFLRHGRAPNASTPTSVCQHRVYIRRKWLSSSAAAAVVAGWRA
jgi:hypothetical protein